MAAAEAQRLYDLLKADKNCKSLLAKHLTKEVFDLLKDRKSKFGGGLADCIRSGKECCDRFPACRSSANARVRTQPGKLQ